MNNLKPLFNKKTYLDSFIFYNTNIDKNALKEELNQIPTLINTINFELTSNSITDPQLIPLYSNIKSVFFNIYRAYLGDIDPYHIQQNIRPIVEGVQRYLHNVDPSSEFNLYEYDYPEYSYSYRPNNSICHSDYSNFILRIDLLNKYYNSTLNYYYKLKNKS